MFSRQLQPGTSETANPDPNQKIDRGYFIRSRLKVFDLRASYTHAEITAENQHNLHTSLIPQYNLGIIFCMPLTSVIWCYKIICYMCTRLFCTLNWRMTDAIWTVTLLCRIVTSRKYIAAECSAPCTLWPWYDSASGEGIPTKIAATIARGQLK